MTIVKIFDNSSKVSYVDLSSKITLRMATLSNILCVPVFQPQILCAKLNLGITPVVPWRFPIPSVPPTVCSVPTCYSNLTLKAKSESGEIWRLVWEKCGIQHKNYGGIWMNLTQSVSYAWKTLLDFFLERLSKSAIFLWTYSNFMTIAKFFHNPSKVSYVDLSSNNIFLG